MDNQHPIPQDITGFQFKLIGQMTIKQFIYLAAGAVIAWIFFFILPLPSLIKWPLSLISLVLGAGFAFVPIDGRPMDVMLGNFIGAIFAPTKFVYKKTVPPQPDNPAQNQTQPASPANLGGPSTPKVINLPPPQNQSSPVPEQVPSAQPNQAYPQATGRILSLNFEDQTKPQAQSSTQAVPQGSNETKAPENPEERKIIESEKKLEEKEEDLQKKLDEAQALENTETGLKNMDQAHKKTEELENMLKETIAQKEELEKQLLILQGKLEGEKQEKFIPSTAHPLRETKNVRKIPKELKKAAGVANFPESPNLITGIIKDSRANPLPNILVEVKDTDDNAVRAFKTNALGQFASATSLSNGKYQIIFEDPKGGHRFDSVEIEATGEVIMPLEIISIDAREELRRELFN